MQTVSESNQAEAIDILSEAFADDPVMNWIGNQSSGWVRFMFEVTVPVFVAGGLTYLTDDKAGAAAWKSPAGELKWPIRISLVFKAFRLGGITGLRRLLLSARETEKYHPKRPHYYLFAIGSLPGHRGQGVGSRLIAHILRRCDDENVPAYLENSKEQNLAFYRGHGFEVMEEIRFAADAPPVWLMWREPR